MFHVDCYQCIDVCPFNKKAGIGHDMVRWSIRHTPVFNKLVKFGDDLLYKPIYRTGRMKKKAGNSAISPSVSSTPSP